MEKLLYNFVEKNFSQYMSNKIVAKVLNDILPNSEDISDVDVVAKNSIITYKLKNSDNLYVLSIKKEDKLLTISSLNDGTMMPTEDVENIIINDDNVVYNSIQEFRNSNGVIVTGASSIMGIDKYNNVVPNKVDTGIWFYDREFLENIGDTDNTIKYLSGMKNPIETINDLNICNYQIYRSLPDMYQQVSAWRNKNSVGNDIISFEAEIEMFNGNVHQFSYTYPYPLESDFRNPIRNVYKSVIKATGIEKELIDFSGLKDINTEKLGVFDVHKNYNFIEQEKSNVLRKDK